MKLRLLALFVGLAALPAFLSAQENPIGQIRAFLVKGDVTLRNDLTGASSPLRRGDTFTDGYTITTGEGASALLLLSNGASIQVRANSILAVQEFSQEAYSGSGANGDAAFTSISRDPSTSKTLLRLHNGEIAGEVKSLAANSTFEVTTPNGSAGIRGTTFVISVHPDGQGGFITMISNIRGDVVYRAFNSTEPVQPLRSGQSVTIGNQGPSQPAPIPQEHEDAAQEHDQAANEAGAGSPSDGAETPGEDGRNESQGQADRDAEDSRLEQVVVDTDIVSPN